VVIAVRKTLWLPLDDLLVVVREFIHEGMSRSALHRLLVRHGVCRQPVAACDKPAHKPFKTYEPGFVHVDVKYLPQMPDETTWRYLFVAIGRATRRVDIAIHPNKSAALARAFLKALAKACPIRITRLLTENEPQTKFQRSYNGKEFTDRLFGARGREPSGAHEFDQLCQALGIEHRLTQAPYTADQRHGRALQWPHRRGAGHAAIR